MNGAKEVYARPALAKHELLRDITATSSGRGGGDGERNPKEIICKILPFLCK